MSALKRTFVIALVLIALFIGRAQAADPLEKETVESFSLPLDGTITIDHTDGSIHIFGWYQPQVRLATLRKAYTEARLEQIQVETRAQPKSLDVQTIIPKAAGLFADRSGTIDYTVTVPETARLNLKLNTGEISLQGLRGGMATVELVNGRLMALNCYANVRAHSVNGVLEVFYEWWEKLPATFDYRLDHGRIGARLPPMARFRVDAATASGGIGNDFELKNFPAPDPGEALKARNAPSPPVSFFFRTGGGNISLDRGG